MGPGSTSPGGEDFSSFVRETTSSGKGVRFLTKVADMPEVSPGTSKLALLAGRTADNPRLLREAVAAGCTAVYLEKPGAPTVAELEDMSTFAKDNGVRVFM